jgi:hypothetical protein
MSERVSLIYDDGSKTDFDSVDDLYFHVDRQGLAGVVEVVATDEDGLPTDEVVATRDDLSDRPQEEKDALAEKLTATDDPQPDADQGGEE